MNKVRGRGAHLPAVENPPDFRLYNLPYASLVLTNCRLTKIFLICGWECENIGFGSQLIESASEKPKIGRTDYIH